MLLMSEMNMFEQSMMQGLVQGIHLSSKQHPLWV